MNPCFFRPKSIQIITFDLIPLYRKNVSLYIRYCLGNRSYNVAYVNLILAQTINIYNLATFVVQRKNVSLYIRYCLGNRSYNVAYVNLILAQTINLYNLATFVVQRKNVSLYIRYCLGNRSYNVAYVNLILAQTINLYNLATFMVQRKNVSLLIYNNVKNLSEEDCKSWKCPNCKQNYVEESGDERIVCDKHEEEPSNLEDSLTLAAEIGQALLRENEELKQALHETSNAKSVYELELEDKIKQKEEEIEIMLEKCKEKEEELLLVITTLRNKLEEEKKLNMELILQAEQGNCGMVEKRKELPCTKCEILKNETKNMISSIRSLEIAAKDIKNENLVLQSKLNNSQCIQCFPPLKLNTGTKQNIVADQNKWQKVPVAHKKSVPPKIQTTSSWIDTNNRFEVLSGEETDEDEFGDDTEVATNQKRKAGNKLTKINQFF
ncbi:hypothetical protein J6590_072733 [Homalodisca vitripennis]|nr:hypothetical protein J6590_072733 [Homalodisca vitripennis]